MFQLDTLVLRQEDRVSLQCAQNAVIRASKTGERHLVLSALKTVGQYLLPDLIVNFSGRAPCMPISAMNGNMDLVREELARPRIQLTLIERPTEYDEICVELFTHDKMVFVVSANHERAAREIDSVMLKGVTRGSSPPP